MAEARRAERLWVVIPAFNEERLIAGCLDSLATQTDSDFDLVVVDNGSVDGTNQVVTDWMTRHPAIRGHTVMEGRKGTGAAADTGFRFAIRHGADWIARTDADCLAAPDWIERIRARSSQADLVGGRIRARRDDVSLRWRERAYLPAITAVARLFGRVRPSNRGREYLCPYVMCVGNNLAVAAGVYEASGGFPRLAIEELPIPNDRALVNRVRKVSSRVRYAPEVVVYNSIRRLRAYGLRRTLSWYASHRRDDGTEVDIR
jgi:glycosyltransferase involved in cell wall biosynthesis